MRALRALLLILAFAIVPSIAIAQTITSTSPLPDGTVGVPYSVTLTCTQCTSPFWAITGTPPPPLQINANTGVSSGTPTTAGTYTFQVQLLQTTTKIFTITIVPALSDQTTAFPTGYMGNPYTHPLVAAGGLAPYTWSLATAPLPQGLNIVGSNITGTPTQTGTFNIILIVTDSLNNSVDTPFTILIGTLPAITTTSLPNGHQNVQYSSGLACSNCGTPIWSIPTGLPPGLTVNSATGLISGIPTTAGTYPFTVRLAVQMNNPPPVVTKNLTIVVIAPLSVTTASLPSGTLNVAYNSSALTATGGVSPYAWTVTSGALPTGVGLVVTSGGTVLSGVPTAVGTYNFTLTVTDSQQTIASMPFSIVIFSGAGISTTTLPNGIVSQTYTAQLVCVACSGYSWSLSSGTLPPVLSISPSGAITGTPSTPGTYNFVVALSPIGKPGLTQPLSITINPMLGITAATLPVGNVNVAYSATLAGTGGAPPYTWSFTSTANDGVTINPTTGVISGIPTLSGQFALGAMITDSGGATANRLFTLFVAGTLTVTTASLPNGVVGTAYPLQTLTANGGQAPFRWSVSTGVLPPGLTLNATQGTISGTPTATGTYPFTVLVNDALSNNASARLSIAVTASGVTITIAPTTLPPGSVNTAYSQALTAAGGQAPYTWAILVPPPTNSTGLPGGGLPAGLTLNPATGVISGTPTTAGTSIFTVVATDSNKVTGQVPLSIVITPTPLSVTTTTLPNGTVGTAYSQTLAATGGTSPYTWTNTGALPAGLTLNASTGVISGTPTAAATSPFTAIVTDAAKGTAQQALSILIVAPLTVSATLPAPTAGASYSQTITATGGVPPYKFAVTSGSLPAGFSLNASTGVISGTATSTGTSNFTISVTDSVGTVVARALTLSVTAPAPPTVTLTGVPANSGYEQQLSVTPTISAPYPVAITGTITLTFAPSVTPPAGSTGTIDDLMIQFSNGSRTANFTIPAGSTSAPSVTVLTGTTAGTITLTTTLTASGAPLGTPVTQTIVDNPGVPFINKVTLAQVPGGVTVTVTGFSSTRDVTNGQFAFVPATNSSFNNDNISVALNAQFAAWWANTEQSNPYGTEFTLTVPFTFTTPSGSSVPSVVAVSVTVTLANTKGASNPVTLSQ
jgi:hypothetical protein